MSYTWIDSLPEMNYKETLEKVANLGLEKLEIQQISLCAPVANVSQYYMQIQAVHSTEVIQL